MEITAQLRDQELIRDVISRVAYILDAQEFNGLSEVFTDDLAFSNPGMLNADSLDELVGKFEKLPTPAISHFVSNVAVTMQSESRATAISKALAMRPGGVISAAEYSDRLVKTPHGWRIAARTCRQLGDVQVG